MTGRPARGEGAGELIAFRATALHRLRRTRIVDLSRVTVILPALNEAAALPTALASFPPEVGLLVVDNGSTDQTATVAAAHGAQVVHEPRRGFGAACWAGVKAAPGEVLVFVDADGSFDGADLPAVAGPVLRGEADLVVGSRIAHRAPGAMSALAVLENRLLGLACRLLFGCRCLTSARSAPSAARCCWRSA